MNIKIFIAKKNYIILAALFLLISLLALSYYRKEDRIKRQTMLGGEVELISDALLHRNEWNFLRGNTARFVLVADLRTSIPLPSGVFETNVRAWDLQPLRGNIEIDKKHFKICFIEDWKTKTFGVSVNQLFLDVSGLKFGDIFKMGTNNYQIRAIIKSMPDSAGKLLMEEPFLMVKHIPMRGSGMFQNATKRELRYLILTKGISAKAWEEKFKKTFPKTRTIVRRWDQM